MNSRRKDHKDSARQFSYKRYKSAKEFSIWFSNTLFKVQVSRMQNIVLRFFFLCQIEVDISREMLVDF